MEVYLDNSATTRTFPEVAELMTKIMCEDYGNPSSLHMKGVEAEKYLRYAKETLARILKVEERELLFTSGGTESDNMALIGCAGSAAGAFCGILVNTKLTTYRLEQLEKKVDKHNTVIERTFKLEEAQAVMQEQIKVANHRIEDLEREVKE